VRVPGIFFSIRRFTIKRIALTLFLALLPAVAYADGCPCTTPPTSPNPGGPTTINVGGSSTTVTPTQNSNTSVNPQTSAVSENVNQQYVSNQAISTLGNGAASCGRPSLSAGYGSSTIGSGGGYTGWSTNTLSLGINVPLGNDSVCRQYQGYIAAHAMVENCAYFIKTFPNVQPKTIAGFEQCQPFWTAPAPQVVYVQAPVVVATPAPAPPPPTVITRTHYVAAPHLCLPITDTRKNDLFAEIKMLRKSYNYEQIARDMHELHAACVSDEEIAHKAIDGP
jgi:hypothetical protein